MSNHNLTPGISKRVADYFALVGSGDEFIPISSEDQPNDSASKPIKMLYCAYVTDRYPLVDHSDVHFPDGVTLFCFPKGIEITTEPKSPSFYSFVHTSENGVHMIGCCLIFYEQLNDKQGKSLRGLLEKYEDNSLLENFHPLSFFVPKCLCIVSHWPFLLSFKKILCQFYRLSLTPSSIPIERYICNFIDDVPAPPAGLVDITYYLGDQAITFRCPPANQPNVWSGVPMSPLFECLDEKNILLLLSAVLVERQIVFISSQYSLLTSCAEVITSLIYPLTWSHVYIPILPLSLLGVLAAPVPFIVGIHSSFLASPGCLYHGIAPETVRVFIDENRIEAGSLGPPPPLPERRNAKLLRILQLAAPIFKYRVSDWKFAKLPFFDAAFEMSVRPDEADGSVSQGQDRSLVDETKLREGFLKFFVAIFRNYRKYLNYGTLEDPFPIIKFKVTEFLSDHPSSWTPLLSSLLRTQAFSQFVDERLPLPAATATATALSSQCTPTVTPTVNRKHADIIFFDESIQAKMNRYTFRRRSLLTPFLSDKSGHHSKTYVPPTPDTSSLPERQEPYIYATFPHFTESLFSAARPQGKSALEVGRTLAAAHQARLRKHVGPSFLQTMSSSLALSPPSSSSSSSESARMTAEDCTYSVFLTILASLICGMKTSPLYSLQARRISRSGAFSGSGGGSLQPSTKQILQDYHSQPLPLLASPTSSEAVAAAAAMTTTTGATAANKVPSLTPKKSSSQDLNIDNSSDIERASQVWSEMGATAVTATSASSADRGTDSDVGTDVGTDVHRNRPRSFSASKLQFHRKVILSQDEEESVDTLEEGFLDYSLNTSKSTSTSPTTSPATTKQLQQQQQQGTEIDSKPIDVSCSPSSHSSSTYSSLESPSPTYSSNSSSGFFLRNNRSLSPLTTCSTPRSALNDFTYTSPTANAETETSTDIISPVSECLNTNNELAMEEEVGPSHSDSDSDKESQGPLPLPTPLTPIPIPSNHINSSGAALPVLPLPQSALHPDVAARRTSGSSSSSARRRDNRNIHLRHHIKVKRHHSLASGSNSRKPPLLHPPPGRRVLPAASASQYTASSENNNRSSGSNTNFRDGSPSPLALSLPPTAPTPTLTPASLFPSPSPGEKVDHNQYFEAGGAGGSSQAQARPRSNSAPDLPPAKDFPPPPPSEFRRMKEDQREEELTASRAGLEVVFEVLRIMPKKHLEPNDTMFRWIAEACAVSCSVDRALELLELLWEKEIEPDQVVLEAVALTFSEAIRSRKGERTWPVKDREGICGSGHSHSHSGMITLPATAAEVWSFFSSFSSDHYLLGGAATGSFRGRRRSSRIRSKKAAAIVEDSSDRPGPPHLEGNGGSSHQSASMGKNKAASSSTLELLSRAAISLVMSTSSITTTSTTTSTHPQKASSACNSPTSSLRRLGLGGGTTRSAGSATHSDSSPHNSVHFFAENVLGHSPASEGGSVPAAATTTTTTTRLTSLSTSITFCGLKKSPSDESLGRHLHLRSSSHGGGGGGGLIGLEREGEGQGGQGPYGYSRQGPKHFASAGGRGGGMPGWEQTQSTGGTGGGGGDSLLWKWSMVPTPGAVGAADPPSTLPPVHVHAASPPLVTQVLLGERTLDLVFPGLHIDLFSPFGTACPNQRCRHPLTLAELRVGWLPDPNRYTTKCPCCAREFVPRFTVHSTAQDWVGSEGRGSSLWCELLSPWVLRKEVHTVLFQDSVQTLLSPEFRAPMSQGAVIFWNLIVTFRLLGLPYAYLLCNSSAASLTVSAAFMIPLDTS